MILKDFSFDKIQKIYNANIKRIEDIEMLEKIR